MKLFKRLFFVGVAVLVIVPLFIACNNEKVSLEFNTDGGTEIVAIDVKIGEKVQRPSQNPTKAGYTFDNWYADAEKTIKFDFDTMSINNKTTVIYAKWNGNNFTVQYDSNGGDGTMVDSNHTYGLLSSLSINTFTRANREFAGWNIKADGSGEHYADGAEAAFVTEQNGVVTLYAQWAMFFYKVVPSYAAADVSQNALWNGAVFEGVFCSKAKILFTDSLIFFRFNGLGGADRSGGGDWQIGGNSGSISYTINASDISILIRNSASGATDGSSFTIKSSQEISGSASGTKTTAYRYDNITGFMLNEDGTGTLHRSASSISKINGDRAVTWETAADGNILIKEGGTLVATFNKSNSELTYNCYEKNGSRIMDMDVTVKLAK